MPKDEIRLSPVGIAVYPHLSRPTRNMADDKDVWEVQLELDSEDEKAKDFLNGLYSETMGKYPAVGKLPYKKQTDRDTGEETGKTLVIFRSSYAPQLFDKYNQKMEGNIIIGMGSVMQVAFTVNFYDVAGKKGMNLYLQSVQVKELTEYGGKKPEEYGFEAEEKPAGSLEELPTTPKEMETKTPEEKTVKKEEQELPF